MVPFSGRPPTMRMRSMSPPPNQKRQIIGLILGLVRYESGGIVGCGLARILVRIQPRFGPPRRRFFGASLDLQLAALEVSPERRPQPLGARRVTLPVAGLAAVL